MNIFLILTLISIFIQSSSTLNFDSLFLHEKTDSDSNSESIFYLIFLNYLISSYSCTCFKELYHVTSRFITFKK